jgi:putative transposase
MKKPVFVNGHVYHIFNRGVEKRNIFMDDGDYFRFVHDLYVFNNEEQVANLNYYFNSKSRSVEKRYLKRDTGPRKLLVDVLVFTMMPNHFHLFLRQTGDNGIVKFMQKLGTGYTNYFNKKYERVGSLFQGRFKAALVDRESHFIHLPFYIHTNPLDLNYRSSTSIDFLEGYRWSSFPDYVGKRNFPSVTERGFILDIFGGHEKYREYMVERLKQADGEQLLNEIRDVIIEVELR